MDKISDELKLEWLTTTTPTRRRVVINTGYPEDSQQLPEYTITPLRRQIHQPSFGNLGKLPPELLCMVFQYLTCDDLETLHGTSTGGHIAVLTFPQYHSLLKHFPTILAILKETRLSRSFTISQIYETFKSPLCTTCSQFGGYVFLPSFTRCCMNCAETRSRFLPISRDGARTEFGVKGKKTLDGLPQLNNIAGFYSSLRGEIKYYTQRLALYSRELVKKLGDPHHTPGSAQRSLGHPPRSHSFKAHQRYMALTSLPCFIPESASMEKGVYCAGCDIRAREHAFLCQGSDMTDYRSRPIHNHITDGREVSCGANGPRNQCPLVTEQHRLHDSRDVLHHLQVCVGAQALFNVKWTRSQKTIAVVDL
ncbi:hypothetical protein MMC29_003657 [Sticta canariensis]|nr:hypothetical protein [Sticta canariensis]